MTMTDAELAEIRAREIPEPWSAFNKALNREADYLVFAAKTVPALLDELAAARKENVRLRQALQDITTSPKRGYCDYTDCIDIATAALHSATEDADDRTT